MEFTATAECAIMGSLNDAGSRLSGRIEVPTLSENGLWYPPMQDISPICASGVQGGIVQSAARDI